MNTVAINKQDLINAIKNNCSSFGDPFMGLYVNASGEIDCTQLSESGDSMPILTFSGMGEFTDDGGLLPSDNDYDALDVAKYIVDDGECLTWNGTLVKDDGAEGKYTFKII